MVAARSIAEKIGLPNVVPSPFSYRLRLLVLLELLEAVTNCFLAKGRVDFEGRWPLEIRRIPVGEQKFSDAASWSKC